MHTKVIQPIYQVGAYILYLLTARLRVRVADDDVDIVAL